MCSPLLHRASRAVLLSAMLVFSQLASAQETTPAAAEAKLVTRVYPVADLVFSPPNYPFQGVEIAFGRARGTIGFGGGGVPGGGGGFGGGGGGMGGGMGGGQFNVQDNLAAGGMLIDDLIVAITTTVDPATWDPGTDPIAVFRDQLIISQTAAAHDQIAKLLADLRKQATQDTITMRATWLLLSGEQYASLTSGMPVSSPPLVDRAKLDALLKVASAAPRPASSPTIDAGEVTCFNGQTVHIITGSFRGVVTSVVPVVGQLDVAAPSDSALVSDEKKTPAVDVSRGIDKTVLAQVAEIPEQVPLVGTALAQAGPQPVVGYQPVVSTQHSGIVLEVTPIAMPEQQAVVLDLKSIVSQWQTPAQGDAPFAGVTDLDQTEVISQQLSTTIRLPLGKPVIAGGLTLEPGGQAGTRLYLVVEAVVSSSTK